MSNKLFSDHQTYLGVFFPRDSKDDALFLITEVFRDDCIALWGGALAFINKITESGPLAQSGKSLHCCRWQIVTCHIATIINSD